MTEGRDRPRHLRAGALLVAALALAGCQFGGTLREAVPAAARAPAEGGRVVERDVEAPEVFQAEEPGLWDGRPSLGGIWVAHPEATDPERAMIRNVETGASVIGALFRRERDNPGPRFQISSEAATALGILAGRPTPIRVTALRLEQVAVAPPAAPAGAAEAAQAPAATRPHGSPPGPPHGSPHGPPRGLRALFPWRRAVAPAAETPPEAAADPVAAPQEDAASRAAARPVWNLR